MSIAHCLKQRLNYVIRTYERNLRAHARTHTRTRAHTHNYNTTSEDSLYWRQRRSELVASALDYETKQLRRSREGSRSPQRRMHLTTAADVRNGTRPRSAPVGDRKTNFQATQWNAPWKAALHEYPFEDPSGPKLRNWRTEGRFRRDPADGDALEATFLSTQSYGGRKICKGCNQMSPKKSHWSPCSSELSKLDDGHWRTYDPVQPKSDNLDWRR